jgi:hypothetical protein
MLVEGPSSLEDRWLSIFGELGEPEALLACTFTFHADFFAHLLARFAEAACESGAAGGRSFTHLPVDVVCDRSRYSGHRIGFNVSLWPNAARLFHPKLLIALFRHEAVWSDGSLNLTPAGWHRNREIALLHRPRSRSLPHQLRDLLAALPRVAAARHILDGTRDQRAVDLPGTYLTSLDAPIGPRFMSAAPKHAEEVHLVAPFFEKDESREAALDDHCLRLLARRYPDARFHVYLPQLEAEPLRVQGQREMFERLESRLKHRLSLHPVPPAPGPLHGKVACVVHTPRRIQRAHMLVGSPNMTRAALTAPVSRGNVESGWIFDENWKHTRRLFRSLSSKACSIDDAEFVEPAMKRVEAWMPLRHASYDPLARTLRVEWKDPADASRTVLRYATRPLFLERGACREFDLVESVGWIVTRKRGGGAPDGCCPIEVPVELLPACHGGAPQRSPQDWLKLLGAVSSGGVEAGARDTTRQPAAPLDPTRGFEWSDRVRDLSARMRYFEAVLTDQALTAVEKEWLHKLVHHIHDSHDPKGVGLPDEAVWRVWVRLELWQAAERLATGSPTKTDRGLWRECASRMQRRLGVSSLSPVLRSQMRVMIKALRGLS